MFQGQNKMSYSKSIIVQDSLCRMKCSDEKWLESVSRPRPAVVIPR